MAQGRVSKSFPLQTAKSSLGRFYFFHFFFSHFEEVNISKFIDNLLGETYSA